MRRVISPSRAPARRRGSIYLLVLGIAAVVAILGTAAVTTSRIKTRTISRSRDWSEAGILAVSAAEAALATLNQTATWRSVYTSDVPVPLGSLGRGRISFVLVDEDGQLADDPTDTVLLKGIATVGEATRAYSVTVAPSPGPPLACLGTIIHTGNAASTSAGADATLDGAPLSTNGTFTSVLLSTLTANVECLTAVRSGTVNGTIITGSAAKPLPPASVYGLYAPLATTIPWSGLIGGTIERAVFSTAAARGVAPNPQGVYEITVPTGSTLVIRNCRFEATLLVTLQVGATLRLEGSILWDPRPDCPALIVQGGGLATIEFNTSDSPLSEPSTLVNFNPAGTPYLGVADEDLTDTYPSELHGVYHVIGATATVNIRGSTRIVGTVLAENSVVIANQSTLSHDSNVLTNPPAGYTARPSAMLPVRGTWQWAAAQ